MTQEQIAQVIIGAMKATDDGCWLDDKDLTATAIGGRFNMLKVAFAVKVAFDLERPVPNSSGSRT